MKASTIVAVVLRLFAIYWLATGAIYFAMTLSYSDGIWDYGMGSALLQFAPTLCYLFLACAAWLLSFKISGVVLMGADAEVKVIHLNSHEFCQIGLVLLGLFLFLNNIPFILNWAHYWILSQREDSGLGVESLLPSSYNQPALYSFNEALIPFLGGLFLIWKSRAISRKVLPMVQAAAKSDQSKD